MSIATSTACAARNCPRPITTPVIMKRVIAISAVRNMTLHRRARTPPLLLRPPSLTTSCGSILEMWSAGTRPTTNTVPRHTTARTVNTRASIVYSIQ